MLRINGQEIYLTRGDTAELKFPAFVDDNEEETPYIFQEDDEVWFRLAQVAGQKPVRIEKQCDIDSENSTAILYLDSSDTENLKFGKYRYEVELISEGEHYTYIEDQLFEISKEVETHD